MNKKNSLIKSPSAWLPIAMSLTAILFTIFWMLFVGVEPESTKDEGIGAHIFQLLMIGQGPIILFFTVKYLLRRSKEVISILAIQFLMALFAFFLVVLLEY